MNSDIRIKQREKDQIIQALSAGVVPRTGLKFLQVGRASELKASLADIDRLVEGGAAFRIVVGEYGSGKTFFLNLVRSIALEKRCVTLHADLSPSRRIHATGGQARSLYAEAVGSMATRNRPEGRALASVIERFITNCVKEAEQLQKPISNVIDARLAPLHDQFGGHDFASVLRDYWRGSEDGNEFLKASALRWLRAEFSTKTEARQALSVRNIINDADVYDAIKLLAAFVQLAGYSGLFVVFDELVNLYKLQSSHARNQNYEQILRMLNDVLQGDARGLGFALGGIPEFLLDPRRGLYSYPALQSRLQENSFAVGGHVDLYSPVLRLPSLSVEEVYLLLLNVRAIFALGDPSSYLVPDEALSAFLDHCNQRIGEAYFKTPRTTVKSFVQFLAILEQNPDADWKQLLGAVAIEKDMGMLSDSEMIDDGDNDLATIKL